MTRLPALLLGALLGVLGALGAAGCSGSPSDPSDRSGPAGTGTTGPAASRSAMTSPTTPSGFRTVDGTALRFALPTSPAFVGDAQQVGPQGALERRWRYRPAAGGGNCVVLTVEQPAFTGDFPQSTMQLFEARSLPGQQNLRNDPIAPNPAGTVAGLSQEATYSAQLDDGSSVPARIVQLTYLTPGRTLISISVTGPERLVGECRLREIAASFATTGREFTGASPRGPGPTQGRAPAPTSSRSATA